MTMHDEITRGIKAQKMIVALTTLADQYEAEGSGGFAERVRAALAALPFDAAARLYDILAES